MRAHLFGALTPALEARRRLLTAVRPIRRVESVAVDAALGRISSRTIRAPADVPSFARAHWDGYAVRARDVRGARAARPIALRIVGEVFAEGGYSSPLRSGEAVAVATGGAIPRGADAVAIFEDVTVEGGRVQLRAPVAVGARISPPGSDFEKGTVLADAGERLGPAALGAAAAAGLAKLSVYARPVVAVVPNGNELRPPGAALRRGAIHESNNAALSAVISGAGGIPAPRAPVRDDPHAIKAALRSALRTSDLVLATGGSSVGERDYLPQILPKLGRLLFHGVAVRPGKPTLAAEVGGKLVIGLPGHPASCLLNAHWMVLPVLRRLARLPGPGWTERRVRLAADVAGSGPGLATVVPLQIRGDRARSTFKGSAATRSLRGADGFAVLPAGSPGARAGASLRACLFDPPLGTAGRG